MQARLPTRLLAPSQPRLCARPAFVKVKPPGGGTPWGFPPLAKAARAYWGVGGSGYAGTPVTLPTPLTGQLIYIKHLRNTSRKTECLGGRIRNTRDVQGDTDLRSNCSRARGLRLCGLFGLWPAGPLGRLGCRWGPNSGQPARRTSLAVRSYRRFTLFLCPSCYDAMP